jgi:multidrug efflux pump subunit AcrA (membrane-fusion protein)
MANDISSSAGFDLTALDVLLDSIANEATKPGLSRDDFYGATNRKLIASTESIASLVWVAHPNGQVRSAGDSAKENGWSKLSAEQRKEVQAAVSEHLKSDASSAPAIRSLSFAKAYLDSREARNGLRFIYVLLRQAQDSDLVEQVFSDLSAELVSQIEIFENTRSAEAPNKTSQDLTHFAQLMQNLGKSGSLKELAFHLVNDVAKITGADRVSYLDAAGRMQAISGASQISFRTSTVRNLVRLGKTVLAAKQNLDWQWPEIGFDGKHLPRNAKKMVEATGSPIGYAVLCQSEGKSSGVLILEYFSDEDVGPSVERGQLITEVVNFSSPVIRRSTQFHSIPAIGILDVVFNQLLASPVRLLLWMATIGLLAWLAIYGLFFVPQPFEIYGEGVLLPVNQRHVFAQLDGEIDQLLVDENSIVADAQQLLVIEAKGLEKEIIAIEGEVAESQQQLRNLQLTESDAEGEDALTEETKRASEVERLKIRLSSLNARLKFFEDQQSRQTVVSPIAGVVTTQNLRERLVDRPINRGDLLMSIAQADGPWHIEVKIPDNRIEFVVAAMDQSAEEMLDVHFRLKSDSASSYTGKLVDLDYRSDLRDGEDRTSVIATVSIDEKELDQSLRLGARVYAKVACGERNNFYLLTYELRDRIDEWFFW